MILAIILVFVISLSGLALTYLFAEDEPFLWRLSAGNVIGSAIFGLTGFIIASFFGLYTATVLISLFIALLPLIIFTRVGYKKRFQLDWQRAKDKLQGGDLKKFWRFAYYTLFFVLFWFFFERAMFETSAGIFTGGSQNLGDLPFHLGAIFGFTDGQNFPPENPSFAGARFSYPFIADFVTACFVKLGAGVKDAMLVQNIFWAFSLLVILERFVFKLTKNRLAGKLAPALLFFSGGLGFLWFFKDFWQQGLNIVDFVRQLPRDYTIGDNFRWGNSLVTLFITQRSLLLGMPITIIVLQKLWEIFATEHTEKNEKSLRVRVAASIIVGLLAGTLPLIHLHSLAVLFIVAAFLFILNPEKWREWIAFGVGVCIIAVPELLWSMAGSATRTSEFFSWHFGWDSGETNFLWFWLKNTGILIPMIIAGMYLIYFQNNPQISTDEHRSEKQRTKDEGHGTTLLLIYLPFLFCFLISNIAKLAPWEWDNIKVLIYWYVGSIPFVALALAWAWEKTTVLKIAAAECFIVLIFSGALDVWRTASGQIHSKVFDNDAVEIAELIKKRTPPNALFLNAPTYNSAVVLSGRRSLLRYIGHLSSHGIDYKEREEDLRRIYSGVATTDILLNKYGVEYILIGPEVRSYAEDPNRPFMVNERFFGKYQVVAEVGQYKVYRVR